MKTKEQVYAKKLALIDSISLNSSNLEYIKDRNKINGTLLLEISRVMEDYLQYRLEPVRNLVNQIELSNYVETNGHILNYNKSFNETKELLGLDILPKVELLKIEDLKKGDVIYFMGDDDYPKGRKCTIYKFMSRGDRDYVVVDQYEPAINIMHFRSKPKD